MTDDYAPHVRLQMQAAAAWQRGDIELAGELHAAAVEAAKAADVQIDRKLGKEPYDPTPSRNWPPHRRPLPSGAHAMSLPSIACAIDHLDLWPPLSLARPGEPFSFWLARHCRIAMDENEYERSDSQAGPYAPLCIVNACGV
jgi:hypothetical protein